MSAFPKSTNHGLERRRGLFEKVLRRRELEEESRNGKEETVRR
jgi:hypothetical protein